MEEKTNIVHTNALPISSTSNTVPEEVEFKEMVVRLWKKRKFILKTVLVFFVSGVFIAFTSPVAYQASCTFVPQTGQKNAAGNLSGLASMMGVNLGSVMSGENLSPAVYPKIVESVPFCRDIMSTPIIVKKSSGKSITLYEYYTDKQYQNKNVLTSIKKYTIGLPGVILSAFHPNKSSGSNVQYSDSITGKVVSLTKEEQRVVNIIQKSIQFQSNPKQGYIVMGYTFTDPEAVAAITDNMFRILEKYVKNYRIQKEQDNLRFIERNYQDGRKNFLQKQADLAAFQDTNRGLTTASARIVEQRLRSEYDVSFTVYNELTKQLEQAKLAVKESAPVLTVIDPVVVPQKKSAPQRVFILVGFLFFGLVLSVASVLANPFFKEIVDTIKHS